MICIWRRSLYMEWNSRLSDAVFQHAGRQISGVKARPDVLEDSPAAETYGVRSGDRTDALYLHSLYGIVFANRIKARSIVLDHGTSHMTVGNRFADTVGGWFEHALTAAERMGCHDFTGCRRRAAVGWLISISGPGARSTMQWMRRRLKGF